MAHALLSASGASRWMACTPSARYEQQFPEDTSPYAEEGTLAHEIGEIYLRKFNGEISSQKHTALMKRIKKSDLFQDEMLEYIDRYTSTVLEKFSEAQSRSEDAVLKIEERLDFSNYVDKGFGTGDAVIIADDILEICDLKYGKGVKVEAEKNPQMMLYALGALNLCDMLYDIEVVRMTIIQPRLDHISTFEIEVEELKSWGENIVKPLAKLAYKGLGTFSPGEKQCKFCRAKFKCIARAEKNLELAKYEFKDSNDLTNEEIGDILKKLPEFETWVKDIKAGALKAALEGEIIPGWKVVEGKAARKITNEKDVINVMNTLGYESNQYLNTKLKGITDLEKLIGKKDFNNLLGDFITIPAGKPTLVIETDKRPAYNLVNNAIEDFK